MYSRCVIVCIFTFQRTSTFIGSSNPLRSNSHPRRSSGLLFCNISAMAENWAANVTLRICTVLCFASSADLLIGEFSVLRTRGTFTNFHCRHIWRIDGGEVTIIALGYPHRFFLRPSRWRHQTVAFLRLFLSENAFVRNSWVVTDCCLLGESLWSPVLGLFPPFFASRQSTCRQLPCTGANVDFQIDLYLHILTSNMSEE